MIEVLNFIFKDFWHFLGTWILVSLVFEAINLVKITTKIIKYYKQKNINKDLKKSDRLNEEIKNIVK